MNKLRNSLSPKNIFLAKNAMLPCCSSSRHFVPEQEMCQYNPEILAEEEEVVLEEDMPLLPSLFEDDFLL